MRDILHESAWYTPESFQQILPGRDLERLVAMSSGYILVKGKIWKIRYRARPHKWTYDVWLEENSLDGPYIRPSKCRPKGGIDETGPRDNGGSGKQTVALGPDETN